MQPFALLTTGWICTWHRLLQLLSVSINVFFNLGFINSSLSAQKVNQQQYSLQKYSSSAIQIRTTSPFRSIVLAMHIMNVCKVGLDLQ